MKIEQLQLVKRTDTANLVLKFLAQRQRLTFDTNLESLRGSLVRKGEKVNKPDFYQLFTDLEGVGAGRLLNHSGSSNAKFIWNYSLKGVSDQILNPNKKVLLTPLEPSSRIERQSSSRPRGRPKGFSPRKAAKQGVPPKKEIVIIYTTDGGEVISLRLAEAERFISQIKVIKDRLA